MLIPWHFINLACAHGYAGLGHGPRRTAPESMQAAAQKLLNLAHLSWMPSIDGAEEARDRCIRALARLALEAAWQSQVNSLKIAG